MKKIVENLENVIKSMGIPVIEKHVDDSCTVIAVKHPEKGIFTVYTTSELVQQDNLFALKLVRLTEHVPFSSVTPDNSSIFISQYLDAVEKNGCVKSIYSATVCPEEFRFFVKCAG